MAQEFYQLCNASLTVAANPFGKILPSMLMRRSIVATAMLASALLSACGPGRAPAPISSRAPGASLPASHAFSGEEGDHQVTEARSEARRVIASPTAVPRMEPVAKAMAQEPAATIVAAAISLNPLTGLPPTDPALLERRPLAIKISNEPRDIRPQYGLNEADVVFEYYTEWGYTRFIGVFYGNNAEQIGPVRSGRYFDEHVTRMYQAYYVFNYADPREYTYYLGGDLQQSMVVPGYGRCPPFFEHRVSSRIADASHYETYFDSTRFNDCLARKSADNSRPDLRSTYFSDLPPPGGVPVDRILTFYSRCIYSYWQYDQEANRYLRFQEIGPSTDPRHINDCVDTPRTYSPLIDAWTGEQVFADNVIVIYVPHTFADEYEQVKEIYHIDLLDSGRAYVFRDGLGAPARWVRPDIDQPIVITSPSGDLLGLRPGRTFFQVLGSTSDEWSDGADWHFDFHTP